MICEISNGIISASIKTKGAELCSLRHLEHRIEYLWQADERFWAKHSPVLFPFVGKLKNDSYFYEGRSYPMTQHGFARDKEFEIHTQAANEICFVLKEDEWSLSVYPFCFELYITYTIKESTIRISYEVKNTNEKDMYFSIGAHPAFRVPLVDKEGYADYSLQFSAYETAQRHLISEGLLSGETEKLLNGQDLALSKELFYKDALVFKNLQSQQISIKTNLHAHGLNFRFTDFPYFGIWAKKDADFICLEPWCGIADSRDADEQLKNKEGIHALPAGAVFNRSFSVEIF